VITECRGRHRGPSLLLIRVGVVSWQGHAERVRAAWQDARDLAEHRGALVFVHRADAMRVELGL